MLGDVWFSSCQIAGAMGEQRQLHPHPTAISSSKFIPTMNQNLVSSVLLKLMKRKRHYKKAV